jgi:hypothetical protein
MVGGWAIEIISLMDGVSRLFRPAIVALLFFFVLVYDTSK